MTDIKSMNLTEMAAYFKELGSRRSEPSRCSSGFTGAYSLLTR